MRTWPFQYFRGALWAGERDRERGRRLSVRHGGELFCRYLDQIKNSPDSGWHSRGRERHSRGGRGLLLSDGEQNNAVWGKGRRDHETNTDVTILCRMFYVEMRVTRALHVRGRKRQIEKLLILIYQIYCKQASGALLLLSPKHIKEKRLIIYCSRDLTEFLFVFLLCTISTVSDVILKCRHKWVTCWHAVESCVIMDSRAHVNWSWKNLIWNILLMFEMLNAS